MEKPKRQRGSGSVFKRKNCHKWTIQFFDADRRRVRESTGTTDRTVADRLLRKRLTEVDTGIAQGVAPGIATVDVLWQGLLTHCQHNALKRGTKDLAGRWNHLKPVFAHLPARKITTKHVVQYQQARLAEKAAPATVNQEVGALKHAFRLAARHSPPLVAVVPYMPMLKVNNARSGYVEEAAFQRLATAASGCLWLRCLLELAFTYGWRRGELLGLRVRQVEMQRRSISLDPGKTKNGDARMVVMTAPVAELLAACIAGKDADDYVLTRANGGPVRDFRASWEKITKAAGTPNLFFHDLRRSAAKRLRHAGIAESVVMVMGGWKTASTFRRYGIVSRVDMEQAVELLGKFEHKYSPNASGDSPQGQQAKVDKVQ
jgi:integrase